MPETERNDYLSSGTFVPLTPNTLTTPEALSAEFDRIRRYGYALDEQEIVQGLVCIAVPIQLEGHVIAAISLVVTSKGGPVRPTAYLARVRAAATEIERKLQPFSRSEEHTSELQSLMRISYAVFCLKKKNTIKLHQCYLC